MRVFSVMRSIVDGLASTSCKSKRESQTMSQIQGEQAPWAGPEIHRGEVPFLSKITSQADEGLRRGANAWEPADAGVLKRTDVRRARDDFAQFHALTISALRPVISPTKRKRDISYCREPKKSTKQ